MRSNSPSVSSSALICALYLGKRVGYPNQTAPPHSVVLSFIGGLGGRDIPAEEFYEMLQVAEAAVASGEVPPPRLLFTEDELRDVRKLQAIAHVEREELER